MEPIGPAPGRVWPPSHCYMDEHGMWWEAPGVPFIVPAGANLRFENCTFDACVTGIFVSSEQLRGDVRNEDRSD